MQPYHVSDTESDVICALFHLIFLKVLRSRLNIYETTVKKGDEILVTRLTAFERKKPGFKTKSVRSLIMNYDLNPYKVRLMDYIS